MAAPYHVGIVVPDLEGAMRELSEAVGATWQTPRERKLGEWSIRVVFSHEGPPFLELIEGSPGSPWEISTGAHIDHLGWWADDVAEEKRRLEGLGAAIDLDGGALGLPHFAYLAAPQSGVRVELIDAERRAGFYAQLGLEEPSR